jgi:hypothetical protein
VSYIHTAGGISARTDISGLSANTSYIFYYAAINSIGVYNPIGLLSNQMRLILLYTPLKLQVRYLDGSANVIVISLSGAFSLL